MKHPIFVFITLSLITACGNISEERELKIRELKEELNSTYLEKYEVLYNMPFVCGTSVREAEEELQKLTKRIEETAATHSERELEIVSRLDGYVKAVESARNKISALQSRILQLEKDFEENTGHPFTAPPMPDFAPDSTDPFAQ